MARAEAVLVLMATLLGSVAIVRPQQVRQVTAPVQHSEGPHWDSDQNVLLYTDIRGQAVHRYDPVSGDVKKILFDDQVSPVIPVSGTQDQLIVGVGRDLVLATVDWSTASAAGQRVNQSKVLASVDADQSGNRFNDGKADRRGRLWIGTLGSQRSSLYRFVAAEDSVRGQEKVDVTTAVSPVVNSNGLAWNDNDTRMYYIDTPTRRVDVFDFDLDNGTIANRRPAFDFKASNVTGSPDGMTIDADGNLWVACYDGSQVIKVDPVGGRLLQQVPIPATQVSSVAFGGRDLDVLYVTTMKYGLTPEQLEQQPAAGAVFAVTGLDVKGQRPGGSRAVIRK